MHYEEKLSPKRAALWAELVTLAGTTDAAHLMGLMMLVCSGADPVFAKRCARPVRETRDRKEWSAGQ
jgi:hypothetical protein